MRCDYSKPMLKSFQVLLPGYLKFNRNDLKLPHSITVIIIIVIIIVGVVVNKDND